MVIYGIALLGACTLSGLLVGKLLGSLFGIEANVGGIGIAMLLLMYFSNSNSYFKIGDISEKGITFWSLIYIPIIVAMAAKQNVIGALDGGWMATGQPCDDCPTAGQLINVKTLTLRGD